MFLFQICHTLALVEHYGRLAAGVTGAGSSFPLPWPFSFSFFKHDVFLAADGEKGKEC
jgi:hypothetical protein